MTQDELKKMLRYSPKTGEFVWLVAKKGHCAGVIAGSLQSRGYLQVGVNGRKYLAHRLAWFYMTGQWPERQVDHRDGERTNNKWKNLRKATPSENGNNRGQQVNNTSGIKGVSWCKNKRKWTARIKVGGTYRNLGYFPVIDDAATAYKVAAQHHHGEFAKW